MHRLYIAALSARGRHGRVISELFNIWTVVYHLNPLRSIRTRAECRKIAQESELPDATNLDREAQSVGFSTIAQFSEAIGEFAEAHDFALKTIAKLHVMQHGGNEWSRTPQKLLTFYLESNTSLGSHRNPSRTFKLKGCQFSVLRDIFAQFPPAAADWAQTEPNRNAIQAAYSRKPAFVCVLPVRLVVEGVNTGRMLFYPLFRPETSADETPMEKVTILSDVLKWFMGSINAGFPLQLITHADNRVPLPGRFTRSHGSWTWGRFFSDWNEYRRGIHKGLDSAIDDLFLGDTIRPDQLMLFFNLL